jgi:hypothetical protein
MTAPDDGLSARLLRWMADNRAGLDALMTEEGSRAIHEEFLMAEGGTLPDRAARIERARGASARAWMRHLGRGLDEVWDEADPGLSEAIQRWSGAHRERLEALVLEEQAAAERRGASGDPLADERDAELTAHCRLFAEALAAVSGALADSPESPPEFSRRLGEWARAHEGERRAVEAEARAAWAAAPPPGSDQRMTAAPEPDEVRVQEAAAVWAHVTTLAEGLEHVLSTRPEAPA